MKSFQAIPVARSLTWVSLAVFFGLIQVWVDMFLGALIDQHSFNLDRLCRSGGLLIFSLTLVSTLAADYLLFGETQRYSRPLLWLTWLIPIVMSIFAIVIYMASKLSGQEISSSLLRDCNLVAVFTAVVYAVILKLSQFLGDREVASS